jgi:hypothetical protein
MERLGPPGKAAPAGKPEPPARPAGARAAPPGPSAGGAPVENLIAGRYVVDLSRPLPDGGGGLPAYACSDQRDSRAGLMAVQMAPGAPPRLPSFAGLADFGDPRMLVPLAFGAGPSPDGKPAWFVVCTAPPGPSIWPSGMETIRPWNDTELVARVMRPIAAVLQMLEERRLTHRAIRPFNIFHDVIKGGPVVLGCAWAGPPGALQPAVFEPPYMAMCAPSARGNGELADDVYALGVTLLTLALGRVPLAGLDADTIVRRKLEMGCFQALAGDQRLSPMIADLASGMMAQDPEHRPTPTLLTDPSAARARRVAARPPRRAQRALAVGDISVFDARSLAFAIARQPQSGARLVRTGVADHWLRRILGDTTMAAKIEDVQRARNAEGDTANVMADARLVMQSVALLDPLAPLCWRGVAVWPDALGPAMVAEPIDGNVRARIEEIVQEEVVFAWALNRAERCTPMSFKQEGKQQRNLLRSRGWAGGPLRLDYAFNPLLPCRSRVLADRPVARLRDLLLALEALSGVSDARGVPPIDRDMAAFIAARMDGRFDKFISALGDAAEPEELVMAQLRVLAELQAVAKVPSLPGLCGWLAELAAPAAQDWHNRTTQATRKEAMAEVVPTGNLASLLAVLDHPEMRSADEAGHQTALAQVRALDVKLYRLRSGTQARTETANRLGQETATVLGLAAFVVSLIAALLR